MKRRIRSFDSWPVWAQVGTFLISVMLALWLGRLTFPSPLSILLSGEATVRIISGISVVVLFTVLKLRFHDWSFALFASLVLGYFLLGVSDIYILPLWGIGHKRGMDEIVIWHLALPIFLFQLSRSSRYIRTR